MFYIFTKKEYEVYTSHCTLNSVHGYTRIYNFIYDEVHQYLICPRIIHLDPDRVSSETKTPGVEMD
jgi:hypothetical protein